MGRAEWGLLAALMLATVLTLSFAPPESEQSPPQVLASSDMRSTAPRPSSAERTPTPTSTPSATPAGTPSPTFTPTSTATCSPTPSPTSSPTPSPTAFPFDVRPDLKRYIYVDQTSQHVFVFEQGTLVRDIPCSTGIPDPDKYTPGWSGEVGEYWGTFFAYEVYVDEAWYLFKSDGSILVHSLPYTLTNGAKVYQDQDALGVRPASHGCIRISPQDAAWLTAWRPEGVPMTISDPCLGKQP